jgi:hypothetical protein
VDLCGYNLIVCAIKWGARTENNPSQRRGSSLPLDFSSGHGAAPFAV